MQTKQDQKLIVLAHDVLRLLNSTEVGAIPLLHLTRELRRLPTSQPKVVVCSYVLERILSEFAAIWKFPPVENSDVERIQTEIAYPIEELLAVITSEPNDDLSVTEKLAKLVVASRTAMHDKIVNDLPCEMK